MFTDEEMQRLYKDVFERMTIAGWLHHFSFTEGKGYHLAWTELGAHHSALLKKIILTFHLNKDDRAPMAFDAFCQGKHIEGVQVSGKLDSHVSDFWSQCVESLQLRGNEDGLLVMVHAILGWSPDENTNV